MLRSNPKISHVNKTDLFRINCLGNNQLMWTRCSDTDLNSASARLPCCLSKGPLKRDFLDIYMTTFSESVISEIQHLSGSSFCPKYLKLHLDLKNAGKTYGKVFCYWDNFIWIGIVKLSLFRTRYFLSAANVLRSSPKILHANQSNFYSSIDLPLTNEYDKSAVTQISEVIGNVYHAGFRRVLWNVSF